MNGIIEWTTKLRMRHTFKTVFLNTDNAGIDNEDALEVMKFKEPLHAITKQASIVKGSQMLISARDFFT